VLANNLGTPLKQLGARPAQKQQRQKAKTFYINALFI
jgi:hypothetical protein